MDNYDILLMVINMNFYCITLKCLPVISFAHRYETPNYRKNFAVPLKNIIEIVCVEGDDVLVEFCDGTVVTHTPPYVHTCLYDKVCKSYCKNGLHRHYEFALKLDYDCKIISSDEIHLYTNHITRPTGNESYVFIVPEYIYDKAVYEKIKDNIAQIIYKNATHNIKDNLSALSYIFRVFAIMTEYSISYSSRTAKNSSVNAYNPYTSKAIKYIGVNIGEKIYVKNIASECGISEGHLCRIFKKHTGYSIVDYINMTKIDFSKKLLETTDTPIPEVAESSGIGDEKYFHRLFKKHTNMTPKEYRLSCRQKPDKKQLEEIDEV